MDIQNPYLPANAQDVDNIPLMDSGEIMSVKNLEFKMKGKSGKRKSK